MLKTLRVGVAGVGTVGVGVVKIIQQNAEILSARTETNISLTAVSSRSKDKDRGVNLDGVTWYDDAKDIANDDNVDVVIELIGGDSGIAHDLVKNSLKNGKHVVTANKALIAHHGFELSKIAEENNVQLSFEAAVAGGIPILKALREGLAANKISSVSGIMNGTCNYILTAMQKTKRDFEPILKEAQELGYAEADPSFDVDGIDTAHKLAILASMAFGMPVAFNKLYIEGIRQISLKDISFAKDLGYKIKLLGICKKINNVVEQRVHPCLVPNGYPIAKVDGVNNAVYLKGDFVGDIVLEGPGAGEGATASSVMADVIDIACGRKSHPFTIPSGLQKELENNDIDLLESEYYLRIPVKDEPKVLAYISDALGESGISIESLIQKSGQSKELVDIVVLTHKVNESQIKNALDKITTLDKVAAKPQMIRIERTQP